MPQCSTVSKHLSKGGKLMLETADVFIRMQYGDPGFLINCLVKPMPSSNVTFSMKDKTATTGGEQQTLSRNTAVWDCQNTNVTAAAILGTRGSGGRTLCTIEKSLVPTPTISICKMHKAKSGPRSSENARAHSTAQGPKGKLIVVMLSNVVLRTLAGEGFGSLYEHARVQDMQVCGFSVDVAVAGGGASHVQRPGTIDGLV